MNYTSFCNTIISAICIGTGICLVIVGIGAAVTISPVGIIMSMLGGAIVVTEIINRLLDTNTDDNDDL